MHPYERLLWISWGIVALGLLLALIGWWGRALPRSLCRRCRYDLSGLKVKVCPECGKDPRLDSRPARRPRWWLIIAAVIVAGSIFGSRRFWILPAAKWWWSRLPRMIETDHGVRFGVRYRIFVERDQDYMGFVPGEGISGMHHVDIETPGGWVTIAEGRYVGLDPLPNPNQPVVHVEADLTGDGVPDFLVWNFSGGAHCCFSLVIVDPKDPGRFFTIDGRNSGVEVQDIDHDGVAEFVTDDWDFEYWKVPFYMSPCVKVIGTVRGGKVALRADLMRAPAWTQDALDAKAAEVRDGIVKNAVDSQLWGTMLKLLYTGNGAQAWEFLGKATPWTDEQVGTFRKEFLEQLSKSQWWPLVRSEFAPDLEERPGAGVP